MNAKEMSTEELEKLLNERRRQEAQEREQNRLAYEELRESTIQGLIDEAEKLNSALEAFKQKAFAQMGSLYELLVQYSNRHAEGKGNFSVKSADDTVKIEYSNHENGRFDERSREAEKHISDFVSRHFEGQPEAKQVITALLERKKGTLDINLIQKLYKMEDSFDDQSWREGIRLLKESWVPTASKSYVNFYRRDASGEWKQVSLNITSL